MVEKLLRHYEELLLASSIPVLLGCAIAWQEIGSFNGIIFLLTLMGVGFVHLAATHAHNEHSHWNSLTWLLFLLGLVSALVLYLLTRHTVVLFVGVLGMISIALYLFVPQSGKKSSISELVMVGIINILIVLGSAGAQSGLFSWSALVAGLSIGMVASMIRLISEVSNMPQDRKEHQQTFAVLFGPEKSVAVFHFFLIVSYMCIMTGILMKTLPVYTIVCMLTLPLMVRAYDASSEALLSKKMAGKKLMRAKGMTVALHMGLGLLLAFGFMLNSFV